MTSDIKRPIFKKLALLGIGLEGSSIALKARAEGLVDHISIYTRSLETLDKARKLNLGDDYSTDAVSAVKDADFIVLCVPLGAMKTVAETIAKAIKPGAILSDVGSSKTSVIADITPTLKKTVHFVPAHPIAGTEHSGPEAGVVDLFMGRWCVLTPDENTQTDAIAQVKSFWQGCGSMVEIMDAAHHDQVLAITSHLPHLIAYTIVDTATNLEQDLQKEVIKFSASGFRDFTRLAASDPVMWRDVFLNNRDAVLDILSQFSEDLTALRRAIRRGEADTLQDVFERTRKIRRAIIDADQA